MGLSWPFHSATASHIQLLRCVVQYRMFSFFRCYVTSSRVTHYDYEPKSHTSCGDSRKPLTRYHPNAQRNRLAPDKVKLIHRNVSNVRFGDPYPRQFVTSNNNYYRGETGPQSANQAIVANKVKFYHALQSR